MSKRDAQRKHARRRASERYEIKLTGEVRREILGLIQARKSRVAWKTSLRAVVHDVTLGNGVEVRVVYDRRLKEIASFLPMEPRDPC